ncbi:putative papain-like cysteine peptidase superfamily [Helianthus debilis subsp. tardiflorus]
MVKKRLIKMLWKIILNTQPFMLAIWLLSDHWSLFIISQHIRHVYILDSTKIKGRKNASNYRLSSLIPTALGSEFNYTMVDCKQQKGGWECGYMVLQHMFDFVNLYQNQFPDEINVARHKRGYG